MQKLKVVMYRSRGIPLHVQSCTLKYNFGIIPYGRQGPPYPSSVKFRYIFLWGFPWYKVQNFIVSFWAAKL